MSVIERTVRLLGTEVRILGNADDGFFENLPDEIREPVLDYAGAVLPSEAVVLDVGANLGLLAIGFARLAPNGRIIAFEPSPTTFQNLEKNVEMAKADNVTTMNVALSDGKGELEFFDSPWFSAGSFVKEATLSATVHRGSILVPARTVDEVVDELGLTRLDVVKIDVEGHELRVLRGAMGTLAQFHPTVLIEMNIFTVSSFGNVLPLDFLSEICSIFPHVYDYRHGEAIWPIASESDMYGRVQNQFRCGRPSELICRFDPLPQDIERELSAASIQVPIRDLTGQGGEVKSLRAQLASQRATLDRTMSEVVALRSSTSWKVTALLRWLSDKLRR